MNSARIHIVYGCDDGYWFPTAVSAASAVHFASHPEKIVLHLFDAGVSDENYEKYRNLVKKVSVLVSFERHPLNPKMFAGYGSWKGSIVTYSRMYIADLLPSIDWAIYVDGDTLWLGDPAELWALRDESVLIQASVDPPTYLEFRNPEFDWYRQRGMEMSDADYLCMGLMVANLKKMRVEGVPSRCQEFMSKFSSPRVVDQTVLNWVCKGKTKALPQNWGVFSDWHGGIDLSKPSLVHYCQDLPWERKKANKLFSDVVMLWFEFCNRVLGLNELKRFSRFTYFWRRGGFMLLRHFRWLIYCHVQLRGRFRNVHGISPSEYGRIVSKM